MNVDGFTTGQRRAIILLAVAVVAVSAMLAGFIITSLQGLESLPVAMTPSGPLQSSPLSPSSLTTPLPLSSPTSGAASELTEGIWSQVQAARLFDQIAHQVETLRSLSPRAEVPLSFLSGRQMTTLLRRFYARRDLDSLLLPYMELGLLPDASIYARPRQVVGIYVPEDEQLYVNADQRESTTDDQALLAHAYIHALQDQHFDLGAMDARATTTDAGLAVQALVEGDAALSTARYLYGDLSEADWERLAVLIMQSEQPDYGKDLALAETWRRLQRFPYWEGRQFVHRLYQAGEWEAVNAAYVDPPRSTEQVLHPERYLDGGSDPERVAVPDLSTVLDEADGWSVRLQDTMGELTIGLYLETQLTEDRAWRAADGWGGDTVALWEHEEQGRLLVWRTIWDTTAEASEFEGAMLALIPERHLPAWPINPLKGWGGQWWKIGEGAVYVSRVARYVVFVQAPSVDVLVNVVQGLP